MSVSRETVTTKGGEIRDSTLTTATGSPKTDDARLGITTGAALGILRRYTCGCAIVSPYGDERELLQPALTCDQGPGHARALTEGWELQERLPV